MRIEIRVSEDLAEGTRIIPRMTLQLHNPLPGEIEQGVNGILEANGLNIPGEKLRWSKKPPGAYFADGQEDGVDMAITRVNDVLESGRKSIKLVEMRELLRELHNFISERPYDEVPF